MAPLYIKNGDKIYTAAEKVPFGYHYAVVVDAAHNLLVHNAINGVQPTTLEEFAHGQPFFIEERAAQGYEGVVVTRALALIGTPYNLLTFNCEHFANLVVTGERTSQQLRNAVGGAAVVGVVMALISAANSNTYDDNGRKHDSRTGRFK